MYGKTYGPFLDPVSQCEHDLQSPGCAMSQRLNRPGKVLNWVPGWWFRLDIMLVIYIYEHSGKTHRKPSRSAGESLFSLLSDSIEDIEGVMMIEKYQDSSVETTDHGSVLFLEMLISNPRRFSNERYECVLRFV